MEEAMQTVDKATQLTALEAEMLGELQVPQVALRALQGARELECEATLLRSVIDAMPPAVRRDPASKEEIVRLLSKVILFRLALTDSKSPIEPAAANTDER
jgi:hypothetical protein